MLNCIFLFLYLFIFFFCKTTLNYYFSTSRLDSNIKTTWHVNPVEETEEINSREGQNLMAIAAKRVWDELYICKKPAIEEVSRFIYKFIDVKFPIKRESHFSLTFCLDSCIFNVFRIVIFLYFVLNLRYFFNLKKITIKNYLLLLIKLI